MNSVIAYCTLVLCVSCVYSAIMPTPAVQRKNTGDSCTFRWNVTGNNFAAYTIKLLSSGNSTALGPNTNHMFDSTKGVIKLFIWNIQASNAGYYSLSLNSEVNSAAALFIYANPGASTSFTARRNPGFEGDRIELNCSAISYSFPVEFRTKTYISWYNYYYGGYFRNISSGPAMLQNGDVLPGHTIKNEGKTLVIYSAQSADTGFCCSVKEEGSPYSSLHYVLSGLQIYSKPYAYSFYPANRKKKAALPIPYVSISFHFLANPPLTSYTNWSFVNASGRTVAYPFKTDHNPSISTYVPFSYPLFSYGNISITLTNSYGSTTTTFQVLPPGPPDTPTNCSVQYVTHSLISLQWRCRWWNGAQQTVIVQLMDTTNDVEVEIQAVTLVTNYCYNSASSTLFQDNIQPETDYKANIWSVNTFGSSDVVHFALRTSKRITFETSPADISITGAQATINFLIADSTKAMLWLNVTCCVELTTKCSNQSYSITITDSRIVYDALPSGTQYVFDFLLYDSDGYTYMSTLAIMKGVRVSRTGYVHADPAKCKCPPQYVSPPQYVEKETLLVAVIVLAVLLSVAVLILLGRGVAFLVGRFRQNNSHHQQSTSVPSNSAPTRTNDKTREPSGISNEEDLYENVVDWAPSTENAYYKTLKLPAGTNKQSSEASREVISYDQEDTYEDVKDDVF